ncbi:hypothetical protein [Shimia thalassica]|uniref:hypothetical protein n=1 Tax=Shimia thalassica TaxID=1715693 RepID=UPI0026E24AE7|nr:hypothetical protein [Shimia thalassica]MDO6481418.1 hypothetical protein [Shimia thalassica]
MEKMEPKRKKKQTKMIGLRVDERLFEAIGEGAKDQGISITSFTRLLIAQALGHFEEVPLEVPRRKARRKPVSADQKKAIQVLALLTDIHSRLSVLVQRSAAQRFLKPPERFKGELLEAAFRQAQKDIAAIRKYLLGGFQ